MAISFLEALEVATKSIKTWAEEKLLNQSNDAKAYTDSVKEELVGGSDSAYNAIKELGDLMGKNQDVVSAIEDLADSKADENHSHKELEYMSGVKSNVQTQLNTVNQKVDELSAEDLGIYVQVDEPTSAVTNNIWIDTSNTPVIKIKRSNDTWREVVGSSSTGSSSASAPKLTTIIMLSNAWQGESSPWYQTVACNGVTANSKIDLQPTPTQIVELQEMEMSLMATNNNGTVTVYAFNTKPETDINMSALITEVVVV